MNLYIPNAAEKLLDILPVEISRLIINSFPEQNFTEITLDLGREVGVCFNQEVNYLQYQVTKEDLSFIIFHLPAFGSDGRVGIPETLHRVSCVLSKQNEIIGLTLRVGKFIDKQPTLIKDILDTNANILLIGPPSSGKTSLLRRISFYTSLNLNKRVIVVDKSSEIGGEGNPAHISIGNSRRFQIPQGKTQAETLLFALESHCPSTLIVDEISTDSEAEALITIAQRGVQVIATAHGRLLKDILKNKPIVPILGNIKTVTLTDETAKERGVNKTAIERETTSIFDYVIELTHFDEYNIYSDINEVVDTILLGGTTFPETRRETDDGFLVLRNQRIHEPVRLVSDSKTFDNTLNYRNGKLKTRK